MENVGLCWSAVAYCVLDTVFQHVENRWAEAVGERLGLTHLTTSAFTETESYEINKRFYELINL